MLTCEDHDISYWPDDGCRLCEAKTEIARLTARAEKAEAALSECQVLLAMWPEVAAQWLISAGIAGDAPDDPLACAIRALTPADAKAALDRMLREARVNGMREAARVINTGSLYTIQSRVDAILAKIKEADHE